MHTKYDYLIVGAGLYGAIFAQQVKAAGKSVLVIDKRPHIAGNVYTESIEGIHVHQYGAHIFHTNDKRVWEIARILFDSYHANVYRPHPCNFQQSSG